MILIFASSWGYDNTICVYDISHGLPTSIYRFRLYDHVEDAQFYHDGHFIFIETRPPHWRDANDSSRLIFQRTESGSYQHVHLSRPGQSSVLPIDEHFLRCIVVGVQENSKDGKTFREIHPLPGQHQSIDQVPFNKCTMRLLNMAFEDNLWLDGQRAYLSSDWYSPLNLDIYFKCKQHARSPGWHDSHGLHRRAKLISSVNLLIEQRKI